jgi:anti-sigma regulatory factor (Ser/Thr protein kinase)
VQGTSLSAVPAWVDTVTDAEMETESALDLLLPARPASVALLRAAVRDWLARLGATNDDVLDLQLACSEALALIVDRPRGALIVRLTGRLAGRSVTVSIRGHGLCSEAAWRRPLVDAQPLGLALIDALVDRFDVHRHADGRALVLSRELRPLKRS